MRNFEAKFIIFSSIVAPLHKVKMRTDLYCLQIVPVFGRVLNYVRSLSQVVTQFAVSLNNDFTNMLDYLEGKYRKCVCVAK